MFHVELFAEGNQQINRLRQPCEYSFLLGTFVGSQDPHTLPLAVALDPSSERAAPTKRPGEVERPRN